MKLKSKKFTTKKQATAWAKKEKGKLATAKNVKWETNYLPESPTELKWEAVIYGKV